MLAAQDVAALCKERGITALHIKLRATGGTRYMYWWEGRDILVGGEGYIGRRGGTYWWEGRDISVY